jgi:hypothetical protein
MAKNISLDYLQVAATWQTPRCGMRTEVSDVLPRTDKAPTGGVIAGPYNSTLMQVVVRPANVVLCLERPECRHNGSVFRLTQESGSYILHQNKNGQQ